MSVRNVVLISTLLLVCSPAAGSQTSAEVDRALAEMGMAPTRGVDSDICYPATAQEYEALGKNAILMLTSSSVLATELPLRSAYLEVKGVRVPLQRIA